MIYVHVPFCHRKCTYCGFYSVASPKGIPHYIEALLREMQQRHTEQHGPVRTLYLGGGTPSLLPLDDLQRIVEGLRRWFDLSQLEEATLEANPEDLTPQYLEGLASIGLFNRLSIGLQAFDDEVLRLIGRRHTAQQAEEAVQRAAQWFGNISVDLIYSLPRQTTAQFEEGLRRALRLPVQHLSAYSLTVEERTALAVQLSQGRIQLPDEEELLRQYQTLLRICHDEGMVQYEVSNFCRPGWHSRHNSRYWTRTPYLGLGPGAHSFDGQRRRWNNPDGTYGEESLTPADAYNELLMTALRTTAGLRLQDVPSAYQAQLQQGMERYIACGWIERTGLANAPTFRPTADGLLHADGIAATLFA